MVTTTSFSSPLHPSSTTTTQQTSTSSPLAKKMSITQTYFLAHKARAKLSREAAQPDHNLRLLVGHANLLDSLMLDLAEAEREQESWFNQSVRGASPKNSEERHIQWADSVPDRTEEDWEADSSDSESDSDDSDFHEDEDEDVEMADVVSLKRMPSTPTTPQLPTIQVDEVLDDDAEEEDEEDYAALTLTRSPSHSASPPELDLDSESSEDESMPPSPPFASIPTFSEKRRESTATETYNSKASEDDDKSDFYNDGYYLPPRNPNRLVSAILVY
ncbi:hypothetical protein PG994_003897 [Apiospora phragmitis]|uniref:Protein ECM13 n=1 Tax=Apiospora phragmitis TaxID=2905665 RepID=A0ABR1W2D6_9PEZI